MKSLSLVLLCLASSQALAFGKMHPMKGERPFEKVSAELNLSEEQKEKFKTIRKESRDNIQKHRSSLKETREALNAALLNKGSSEQELVQLNEKLAQAKMELMREQFAKLMKLRAILSPEQIQKLSTMGPKGRGKRGANDEGSPIGG